MSDQAILVIGDTHLSSHLPGLLDAQIRFLDNLIQRYVPREAGAILFLGDVFNDRIPKANVLLAFQKLLRIIPCHVGILRGNHDSQTKADDGITALSLFENTHVKVFREYEAYNNLHFIPHYESDSVIIDILSSISAEHPIVFGHFGYFGCMGAIADYEFSIPTSIFKGTTILGHIHHYKREGNITILGTPYTTDFGESGKTSYIGLVSKSGDGGKGVAIELRNTDEIQGQIRHLIYNYEDLEKNKESISNPHFFTLLRVLIDPLSEANSPEIIRSIINEYKVKWVEVKFKSFVNDKAKEDLSSYRPNRELVTINDQVLEDYVEANNAGLTKEDLMSGLKDIRNA